MPFSFESFSGSYSAKIFNYFPSGFFLTLHLEKYLFGNVDSIIKSPDDIICVCCQASVII